MAIKITILILLICITKDNKDLNNIIITEINKIKEWEQDIKSNSNSNHIHNLSISSKNKIITIPGYLILSNRIFRIPSNKE